MRLDISDISNLLFKKYITNQTRLYDKSYHMLNRVNYFTNYIFLLIKYVPANDLVK